jgi:hypothetical protein
VKSIIIITAIALIAAAALYFLLPRRQQVAPVAAQDSTAVAVEAAPEVVAEPSIITTPRVRAGGTIRIITGSDSLIIPPGTTIEVISEAEAEAPVEATAPVRAETPIRTEVEIVRREPASVQGNAQEGVKSSRYGVFAGGGYGISNKAALVQCGLTGRLWQGLYAMTAIGIDLNGRDILSRLSLTVGGGVRVVRFAGLNLLAGGGIDNHRRGLVTISIGR